jgi:phospholipase C
MFVVSPYARRHYVSHVERDHTAILRFIQARYGLPALSNRDANADVLMDYFDFDEAPHAEPPTFAEPAIDPKKVEECKLAFPGGG